MYVLSFQLVLMYCFTMCYVTLKHRLLIRLSSRTVCQNIIVYLKVEKKNVQFSIEILACCSNGTRGTAVEIFDHII